MESVRYQEVDAQGIKPAHIPFHPVVIEIVGIAAETFAHHPVFPVLFRRGGDDLPTQIEAGEIAPVRDIRCDVVESRDSRIFLQSENIHPVGRRDRNFLPDPVSAEEKFMRFAPVVDGTEERVYEELLHRFPVIFTQ